MKKTYTVKATVQKFPQQGGWYFVSIPQKYEDLGVKKPKWGLVPAEITLGKTTWQKSLLPMGDGSLFIALSAQIRKKEGIGVGDTVTVKFRVL
jgi:hypothetical protein